MESATDTIKRIKSTVKRIGASLDQSDRLPRTASRSSSQQRDDDIEDLRTALRAERERTRSLQTDLDEKVQLLREFSQVDAEMKANLEQLQQDYQEQARDLADAKREIAALRKKLDAAEAVTSSQADMKLGDLQRENDDLRQEVKDINSTAELYQEQIAALRNDYQELRQEYLASRSVEEVEELRNRVQELELVVKAFQKPAELQFDSRSSSPSLAFPQATSAAQICESLQMLLRLDHYDGIMGAVQRLTHHSKVVRKLGELITSMSPPDTYTSAPTSNQVLKWVNRLANDYVKLQDALREAKEVLGNLKRAAGVSQAEDVVQRLHSLSKEVQTLTHLRDAVVALLALPAQASLRDIKEALTIRSKG